jgi:hypothetical protein
MKTFTTYLALLAMVFHTSLGFAAGKLQNEDFKSAADLVAAGSTAAHLLNDSKIYVASNGINDTLANAIVNGQIGSSAGGVGVELLSNPGFESGGATQGWSTTGGTVVTTTSGSHLFFGNKSADWVATASGQKFQSSAIAIAGLAGQNCSASFYYQYGGTNGDYTLQVTDGTNILNSQSLQASSATYPVTITFPCGAASTNTLQWQLVSNVASPGHIYFDNAHLGSLGLYSFGSSTPPTVVTFCASGCTYGTSGTWTVPANAAFLKVRAAGGGGGGGGSSGSGGNGGGGGTGGNTTFGSSLLTANGGGGGVGGGAGQYGGAGGSSTISAPAYGSPFTGGNGGGATYNSALAAYPNGGMGGANFFGGAGGGGAANQTGTAPAPNTGAGGGGAGANTTQNPGGGGGAGGALDAIVPSPLNGTYAWSIGAIGSAGAAGGGVTPGNAGAAGAGGYIEVTIYYNPTQSQAYLPQAGGLAAGDIVQTASLTCPLGTIGADGASYATTAYPALFAAIGYTYGGSGANFNVPNSQGVFLRGAGTNGIYSATQNSTVNPDMVQGHKHTFVDPVIWGGTAGSASPTLFMGTSTAANSGTPNPTYDASVGSPITDGSNGTPRTGTETRPANIVVKICIRTLPATPAPIMVNTVVSNPSGTEVVERADINCVSGPSISRQSGSWLASISRSGTGTCALVINSGVFSSAPTCVITPVGNSAKQATQNGASPTTTGVSMGFFDGSGAAADSSASVICMGPR